MAYQQPYTQQQPPAYYPPQPQQQQQPYYPPPQQYQQPHNPPNFEANYHPPQDVYANGYEKFTPRPKYQDLWAAIFYILTMVGFIVLAVFAIPKLIAQYKNTPPTDTGLFNEKDRVAQIILLVVALAVGFVLSLSYLLLMQAFASIMIKVTLVLAVVFYFAMAIWFFVLGSWISAAIGLLFALLYAFCAWTWRDRIPFATVMLQTVTAITRKYPGTIAIAIGGLIVQVAWSILFSVTAFGVIYLLNPSTSSSNCRVVNGVTRCNTQVSGVTYVLYLFCIFCFYWTSQVIKNVVHVTVCGVFGVYYFLYGTPQMPKGSPTLQAMKRALTTSFGSICFGSLIIAVIQTLRALVRILADQQDGILAFVACLLLCILGCIESIAEYFNHYAFTQVAIYGKPFATAAKDTWTMIKDRGIEAIINDNLVGNVLFMGALLIGILTAVIGYIYVLAVRPSLTSDTATLVLLLVICGLIGLTMMNVVASIIESGTATTFVALGEDPDTLRRNQPHLFEKIRQTWPEVVMGVRG